MTKQSMSNKFWSAIRRNRRNISNDEYKVAIAIPSLLRSLDDPGVKLTDEGRVFLAEYSKKLQIPETDPELAAALKML